MTTQEITLNIGISCNFQLPEHAIKEEIVTAIANKLNRWEDNARQLKLEFQYDIRSTTQ